MANTFLLSNNLKVGKSLIENDFVEVARDIQDKAKLCNCKIILPVDVMCSSDLNNKENIRMCNVEDIFDDHMILDIGDKTSKLINTEIVKSRSILWNGPLGAFENKPFDKGSIELANTIERYFKNNHDIEIMAGGGDTLAVINLANANYGFSYLSNAGGAFLEWLEGDKSPGVKALDNNNL